MQKWKKAAVNIALLTIILTTGILNSYPSSADIDPDKDADNQKLPKYSQDKQEKVALAFEDNDYQAWKEIVGTKSKIGGAVNESDFQRFVNARKAARSGQYDEAIRITEELKAKVAERLG